jgi:hypothetical protein
VAKERSLTEDIAQENYPHPIPGYQPEKNVNRIASIFGPPDGDDKPGNWSRALNITKSIE